MVCSAPPFETGFVGGFLSYADCQAQSIGAGGYQALAAPGSTLSLTLTGLLTVFVALFGYRMLFGEVPTIRDSVLALVKVGTVLALATGWSAYRTLVYDVTFKAPAEIAADIGGAAGLPGSGGGLAARLDNADHLLLVLAEWGNGAQGAPNHAPALRRQPSLDLSPAPGAPPPGFRNDVQESGSFDAVALGGARILFLTGAAGALATVRLIAGLLLALAPFFIAFLLFGPTRGLFVGWLRVLGGAALGALGAAILLGVQLAFIEPRIVNLIALRTAGYGIPGAAVELFVTMLIFSIAVLAMIVALARVMYSFRLPAMWRVLPVQWGERLQGDRFFAPPALGGASVAPAAERSRASAVADALTTTQRREARRPVADFAAGDGSAASGMSSGATTKSSSRDSSGAPRVAPTRFGQSYRRTHNRTSLGASRRDRPS